MNTENLKMAYTGLLCLLCVSMAHAQVNPKAGYIITNDNDSITGIIDYRTDARNTMECRFQKGGVGEFSIYTPSDIKGYRLSDKGAFYLSKTVDVNGKTKKVFAEYLLEGGVSLYYISFNDGNYYYFEGENGKTGLVKERDYLDYSGQDGTNIKRQDMNSLSQIFYKDSETIEKLWAMSYDKKKLTRLTRNYSEKFCANAGDCIEYLYDEKKAAALKARLFVGAGVKAGRIKSNYLLGSSKEDAWFSSVAPNVTVGCELELPRLSHHLFLQAHADISYLTAKKDGRKLTACNLQNQFGLGYRLFEDRKVTPIVRGGIYFNHLLGASTENMPDYIDYDRHFTQFEVGVYAGIGADVALGSHILRAAANYEYNSNAGFLQSFADKEGLKCSTFSLSVGVAF